MGRAVSSSGPNIWWKAGLGRGGTPGVLQGRTLGLGRIWTPWDGLDEAIPSRCSCKGAQRSLGSTGSSGQPGTGTFPGAPRANAAKTPWSEPPAPQAPSLPGAVRRDRLPHEQTSPLPGPMLAPTCHHRGRVVQSRAGKWGIPRGGITLGSQEKSPKHDIPSPRTWLVPVLGSGLGPMSRGRVGVSSSPGTCPTRDPWGIR